MRFYLALLFAVPALAQHDMSNMPGMTMTEPMAASGTSVNPASSPMNMIHLSARGWSFMFHGVAFVTDIQESGPRGADKFLSMNWFMGEADRPFAGGTFSVRSMLSLDPATITRREYPELFQTGETAFGKPAMDGQHPHNFVMEAALDYTHRLGEKTNWEIYLAPVGDPALGPVAFPHRVSAAELPQAPLGHHLEDSTHISYEVVTAGITRGIFHLEASGFHGAEPNENRWTVGYGGVDSYSARLTISPDANWTGQISAGRLTRPEALEPGDQIRSTASVTWNRPYAEGNWATTVIWGRVHKTDTGANLNGYGLESVARFNARNYVTGRIELVDKEELIVPGNYRIGAYTEGYTRDFYGIPRIATGVGANFTTYTMPGALNAVYGLHPVAVLMFVRFKLR